MKFHEKIEEGIRTLLSRPPISPLTRYIGRVLPGEAYKDTDTFRKYVKDSLYEAEDHLGQEWRAHMTETSETFDVLETNLRRRQEKRKQAVKRVREKSRESVQIAQQDLEATRKQLNYAQNALKLRDERIRALTNDRYLAPIFGMLERISRFDKVNGVCFDTNMQPVYVTPALLETFGVTREEFFDRVPQIFSHGARLLDNPHKEITTGDKTYRFGIHPEELRDKQGKLIATFVEFSPKGPISKLFSSMQRGTKSLDDFFGSLAHQNPKPETP